MGAWIETSYVAGYVNSFASHPIWVRGLKQQLNEPYNDTLESHPIWVRGLKLQTCNAESV